MAAGTNGERLLRELEVDLECPICMEVFGDPRSLTCGHVFCRPCLEKLVKEQYRVDAVIERSVICPECRNRDVFSYGESVADLQRPLSLRKLADFRDKIADFIDAKSARKSGCDFCEEAGGATEAAYYCYECLLNLCSKCLEEHNTQGAFWDHTVTSLTQDAQCRCRKGRLVRAFCHDCQALLCAVCVVKSHPQDHKTLDIRAAATERRRVLADVIPSVKFQIAKFHAVKDTVEQVEKRVDIEYAALRGQLDEHEGKLCELLRNKITHLKAKLKEVESGEKQKLKRLFEEHEDCLTNKLSQVRSMEELLEGSSDVELLQRSADFQSVIKSQPFGNIVEGLKISIPTFSPLEVQIEEFSVGCWEPNTKLFPISSQTPTDDKSTTQPTAEAHIEPQAPKIPPRIKPPVAIPEPANGRSRKKERKRHGPSPTHGDVTRALSPTVRTMTPDPEVVPPAAGQPPEPAPDTNHVTSPATRAPADALPRRRKLRIPAPGRYSQFRLVSELLNCESGLVKDFKFNQKQHQLYVSTDDNNEPIQVYDFGMQKLGSIGRGVVSDVHQLCIDEISNNVAVLSDKGTSIKLLNSFGQLKQVTSCQEVGRVWDIGYCRETGDYVVAYQEASANQESAAVCLNWGVAFIDPASNRVARKSETTYQFQSIPNICYLSHLEAVALSDHCCVKLFDLNGRLIGDIGDDDLQGTLIKDTCEGQGGHLITACEETLDVRALRFGAKGGDYSQYGLAHGQSIVTSDQLLGGKPKLVDLSKDGFLAVQTVGKYRPRRAPSRSPLIARLQIFSGSYMGH